MILVDTSTLIDFLKGSENESVEKLIKLLNLDIPFAISSVIFQEVLQGAKNEKEFKYLSDYLQSQRFINPIDPISSFREAAHIYYSSRRKGITIRSTIDCLIAQTAIEHSVPLLHSDSDFYKISKITTLTIF